MVYAPCTHISKHIQIHSEKLNEYFQLLSIVIGLLGFSCLRGLLFINSPNDRLTYIIYLFHFNIVNIVTFRTVCYKTIIQKLCMRH